MPEVFTCFCGNQHWIIRNSSFIECTDCGRQFTIDDEEVVEASEFNERREEFAH